MNVLDATNVRNIPGMFLAVMDTYTVAPSGLMFAVGFRGTLFLGTLPLLILYF